jgi:hypothetical protein
MLILDDRETDLAPYLKAFDVPVSITRLDSGDARWEACGPSGPILVGVERKKLSDLVDSIRSRRLDGFQLAELAASTDRRYLLVEARYRPGKTGVLEEWKHDGWEPVPHSVTYREVDGFLAAIEEFFGARVARTWTTAESAAWLVARYKWWRKPYREHRTGQLPYAPNPTGLTRTVSFIGAEDRIRQQYGDPGVLCWKWAAQLPGIDRKADQVVARFLTGKRMALANYEDWIGIDGIGEITANRAIHEIRGPENAA